MVNVKPETPNVKRSQTMSNPSEVSWIHLHLLDKSPLSPGDLAKIDEKKDPKQSRRDGLAIFNQKIYKVNL